VAPERFRIAREFPFPTRIHHADHISARRARLVDASVTGIGTHSLRRTKASIMDFLFADLKPGH
jgi:hypothetical protein